MTLPDHVEANNLQRERLRSLIQRLDDAALRRPVTADWTVATVLGHMAFWDARAVWLADRIERGTPFGRDDGEPDDVSWINGATGLLTDALPPRVVADLALRLAEDADRRVAALPPSSLWPTNPDSLLNAFRSEHRAEHLDEIEAALDT